MMDIVTRVHEFLDAQPHATEIVLVGMLSEVRCSCGFVSVLSYEHDAEIAAKTHEMLHRVRWAPRLLE